MRKSMVVILVSLSLLSGCSATSAIDALTGTIGSKPDLTAQVGAENVKQGVGVSNKTDTSSKVENNLKDSTVDNLDTSSKKKVSTSSISADTIKADKIEIRNSDGQETAGLIAGFAALIALVVGFGMGRFSKKK